MANLIQHIIGAIQQDKDLLGDSTNWENWESKLTLTTCQKCYKSHGTIFPLSPDGIRDVEEHPNCKCRYVPMRTKEVGKATEMGIEGADAYLVYTGKLPDYYVDRASAEAAGWNAAKGVFLADVLPQKMLYGGIFRNSNRKLPHEAGRIWHEADINYNGGYRGTDRILFSNDGLLFATYDHYHTFYEITRIGNQHV